MRAFFTTLLALSIPYLSVAQNSTNSSTIAEAIPSSTFYLAKTETQFSISIAANSSDVYLYVASPAYSWVGFGFGAKMAGSLMVVLYANAKGDNITVSTRLGQNAAEPTHTSTSPALELLPGTGISQDGMFILRARCSDCRVWSGGSLDTISTTQPMIYAFGPGNALQSNDPSANLRRHARYGKFSIDLRAATGAGGVPVASSVQTGVVVGANGALVKDRDRAGRAHAVLGCLALFVLWPINVLVAGFFKNIRWHIGASVMMFAFLIVSYALGIVSSGQYNRSKYFTSPHQILAFVAVLPLLLTFLLSIRLLANLHRMIPRLHSPFSSLAFLILIITGGLGLALSSQSRPVILAYTAVALLVAVFTATVQHCIQRRGSARVRAKKARRAEDDDRAFMLGKMTESQADRVRPGTEGSSQSAGTGVGVYGAGEMPGPRYMMAMHPGVPVSRW